MILLGMCRRITWDSNGKLATIRVDIVTFTEGTIEASKAWLTAKEVKNQCLKGLDPVTVTKILDKKSMQF